MSSQTSFEAVEINLGPDQSFFRQTEDETALVLVDKIEIHHYAQQIILSGTRFNVDYENKEIDRCPDRTHIHFETILLAEHSDGED